jgi:hypothetical protein
VSARCEKAGEFGVMSWAKVSFSKFSLEL